MAILDDPERERIVSDAVWLEVIPKPRYYRQHEELKFYEAVFEEAEKISWNDSALTNAKTIAENHGIAAMDAIHVAHAIEAGADELISAEKPTKPMFRVKNIALLSIRTEL